MAKKAKSESPIVVVHSSNGVKVCVTSFYLSQLYQQADIKSRVFKNAGQSRDVAFDELMKELKHLLDSCSAVWDEASNIKL